VTEPQPNKTMALNSRKSTRQIVEDDDNGNSVWEGGTSIDYPSRGKIDTEKLVSVKLRLKH
jgi:hypothetical protein